jgi:hypothetical protein
VVKEGLKKLGWKEVESAATREGDPRKVKLALRLRAETGRNHQIDCSAVAEGQLDARESSAILAPEEIEMIADCKYYKTRNRPLSQTRESKV